MLNYASVLYKKEIKLVYKKKKTESKVFHLAVVLSNQEIPFTKQQQQYELIWWIFEGVCCCIGFIVFRVGLIHRDYTRLFCVEMYNTLLPRMNASPYLFFS